LLKLNTRDFLRRKRRNKMIEKIELVSILIGALGIIASASFLLFI